jgi:exosome complex RNA-binding protein Rrp4
MNSQYLLPGERDRTSSIVHTHGIQQNAPSTQERFISIPRIYEPKEKDLIIGVVIVRTPDLFLVDINSSESAILPTTSFDNGRLPSRNSMNRLHVVYAHVVRTDSWTQTELSCQSTDASKRKGDFGLIEQGNIIRCSLALCEKLQRSKLINHFNRIIKDFRIRITRNGFVWYITDTLNSMIAVKNVLYKHEFENDADKLIELYQTLMNKLQQHDDNVVQAKQQQPPPAKIKRIEQPTPKNTAVDRLLNQVVKSVLDKIIDEIENT